MNKLFKKFYAYILVEGKKETVETYTVFKETSKESIIKLLKEKNIKFDGVDSVYPAI